MQMVSLMNQTGQDESDQSVLVDWPFEPLSSRDRMSAAGACLGKRWRRLRVE